MQTKAQQQAEVRELPESRGNLVAAGRRYVERNNRLQEENKALLREVHAYRTLFRSPTPSSPSLTIQMTSQKTNFPGHTDLLELYGGSEDELGLPKNNNGLYQERSTNHWPTGSNFTSFFISKPRTRNLQMQNMKARIFNTCSKARVESLRRRQTEIYINTLTTMIALVYLNACGKATSTSADKRQREIGIGGDKPNKVPLLLIS